MNLPSQISVSEAIRILQSRAARLETEQVALQEAYGRILAEDVASLVDHPSHDNSALDGYACRAADTKGATRETPIRLELIGDIPAGSLFDGEVGAGQAVGIYTGAPIPDGADAIIRVEDTAQEDKTVLLYAPASPNDIRPRGQDFKRAEVHLKQGQVLDAASVGVAAAMGHATLTVSRRPRVAILATGDEVIEPGQALRAGQVYNANTYSVSGLIRAAGAEPVVLKQVEDDIETLERALEKAGQVDLVLTSGGVSMGKYDFVRDLLFDHGEVHFWKVAQKPAGPVLFGSWRERLVLGLPGNPVSSMIAFILLASPFLYGLTGQRGLLPYQHRQWTTTDVPLKSAGFKETFARVKMVQTLEGIKLRSTGNQSSGVLTSMVLADALAVIPPHTSYEPGDRVEVIALEPYL